VWSVPPGSTRLGFQHKEELNPGADPERTANIPALGVA